jgi:signal transduction histidine kinase
MEETDFILVSVQDIREELDRREIEAWQKLIRVLTHEIMNSVSPITSLTASLNAMILKSTGDTGDLMDKVGAGMKAVQERSEGLLKFTRAYQDLARIPKPVIKDIRTRDFLSRMEILFRSYLESGSVSFTVLRDKSPEWFRADPDLLEQVLINLLRNAMEAVRSKESGRIVLAIETRPGGKVAWYVEDNGDGIEKDRLDRIFIPFYSTRKDGSGIGLSLSRQIVLMHHGSMDVRSEPGQGSTFEVLI